MKANSLVRRRPGWLLTSSWSKRAWPLRLLKMLDKKWCQLVRWSYILRAKPTTYFTLGQASCFFKGMEPPGASTPYTARPTLVEASLGLVTCFGTLRPDLQARFGLWADQDGRYSVRCFSEDWSSFPFWIKSHLNYSLDLILLLSVYLSIKLAGLSYNFR